MKRRRKHFKRKLFQLGLYIQFISQNDFILSTQSFQEKVKPKTKVKLINK